MRKRVKDRTQRLGVNEVEREIEHRAGGGGVREVERE